MGPSLATRLLLVSGLLSGLSLSRRIGKTCPCDHPDAKILPKDRLPDDTFLVGTGTSISCCKDILLGYHDPGASIQWSFNGEAFSEEWSSSLRPAFCGLETIKTTFGEVTDRGNYSCTITATGGTSKTFTMKMTMENNVKFRDVPKAIKSSSNEVAQVGDRVDFTCESHVGTNNTSGHEAVMWWIKYFPNQTYPVFANRISNVSVTTTFGSGRSWGMIKSRLVISSVQDIHFGIYQCIVRNNYGTVSLNMSLTEGIPEEQARILRYKATVVVVASLLGLLVVILLGWCRWGRLLCLYSRHRKATSEDHQHDVFLVHGESVSRWVWSILLPALEDSFGYSCFLPQRDMCGGSMVAESILEVLPKCRRVVVVMTPCLLDSPWATWATYSGIQTALTSRARILALVHKEQSFMRGSVDQNPLLSVLKVVKKIKVPEEFAWDLCEKESPLHHSDTSTQKADVQKTELKLIIPEIKVRSNSSNSLSKSQRLSNMISGSTTASKEDLGSMKDKDSTTEVGGPVVFTSDDHGPQDPGSPSSVTPFILPSQRKPFRPSKGSVCESVGRCLQMACFGSPKEQFWQKLRLHLGPPSLSRTKDTDK